MTINERNPDMSVKIIVDSTADLNEAIKDQVAIVPLTICFGEEEYVDGVTITHHQFYEKLVESDILPTTSQAYCSDACRTLARRDADKKRKRRIRQHKG